MGGTGNARIVVAHTLFAAPAKLVVAQIEASLGHRRRSASMVSWFCEVADDAGMADDPSPSIS